MKTTKYTQRVQNICTIYDKVEQDIDNILKQANLKKDDEVVLVYGNVGAGKSFLCHFMNSEQVAVIKHNSKAVLEFQSKSATKDISHSASRCSKTKMPKIFKVEGNKHFIDCPGIKSTIDSTTEDIYDQISQSITISKLLSKINCKKKILLVIEYSKLSEAGGQEFCRYIEELKLVPRLLDSMSLLFTKVPIHINIVEEVQKVIKDKRIEEDISKLLYNKCLLAFPKAELLQVDQEYLHYTMMQNITEMINRSVHLDIKSFNLPIETLAFSEIAEDFKEYIKTLVRNNTECLEKLILLKIKQVTRKEGLDPFINELTTISHSSDLLSFIKNINNYIQGIKNQFSNIKDLNVKDIKELPKVLGIFEQLSFYDRKDDYNFHSEDYHNIKNGLNSIIKKIHYLKGGLEVIRNQEELIIYDNFVNVADINKVIKTNQDINFSTLKIYASVSIYFNEDVTLPSKNLVLISPQWYFCRKVRIDLSGIDAAPHTKLQADKNQDGLPGLPGFPGGNFFGVYCKQNSYHEIDISSEEGRGGPGQCGGDGDVGENGSSGQQLFNESIGQAQSAIQSYNQPNQILAIQAIKNTNIQDFLKQENYLKVEEDTKRCFYCCIPEYYTKTYTINISGIPGNRGADGGLGGASGSDGAPGTIEIVNAVTGDYQLLHTNGSKSKQQDGVGGKGGRGGKNGDDFHAQYIEFEKVYKVGYCNIIGNIMNLLTCCPTEKPNRWNEWEDLRSNRHAPSGSSPKELNENKQPPQDIRQINKNQVLQEYFEHMHTYFNEKELSSWEGALLSDISSAKRLPFEQKQQFSKNVHEKSIISPMDVMASDNYFISENMEGQPLLATGETFVDSSGEWYCSIQ